MSQLTLNSESAIMSYWCFRTICICQHAYWKVWFRLLFICGRFSSTSYTVIENRSKLEKLENCWKFGWLILEKALSEGKGEKKDAHMSQTQASYRNDSTKWHCTFQHKWAVYQDREVYFLWKRAKNLSQGISAFRFRYWLELSTGKNMEQCKAFIFHLSM